MDFRKIVIVLLIAILTSVFVFSAIDAVYPSPDYGDYCDDIRPRPVMPSPTDCPGLDVPQEAYDACDGRIGYAYGPDGCAIDYYCETCDADYQAALDAHRQAVFYISAALALLAILVGLYLPAKRNTLNEWVGTGFLLAGAFVLLFGTVQSFESLHRYVKPVVLLLELLLVLFLAYKKIGNLK